MSKSAPLVNVPDHWVQNTWPELRSLYKDEDIFNEDETRTFYKLMPDKTLKFKNKKCISRNLSKERVVSVSYTPNKKKCG